MDSTYQQTDSQPSKPKHTNATNQEATTMDEEGTPFIGYLDVTIHQARDIHNICIYHKQDVYAKVSLMTDDVTAPDSVSTRTINGGGRNPVFNESLRLGVRALESSIRCEIWMLSRVKNYLQDQLLGLTLIPLSDLLAAPDNKLNSEFVLSTNDLFESPSGFVQLSLSYAGSSPEVIEIPSPVNKKSVETKEANGSASASKPVRTELEKIEFPDLELVKENQIMVSEYFGIPCTEVENAPLPSSESLITTKESENPNSHEAGVRVVESFSTTPENSVDSVHGEPESSVSTTDSPVTYTNSDKDKSTSEVTENEAESSETVVKPMINIKIEQEQTVNQKDIVDMYMKSMQQFTESLAKMKLPNVDFENGSPSPSPSPIPSPSLTTNSNSSENGSLTPGKRDGSVKDKNSRVFYGSRAFF
ncbi:Calcium-dependent lipid-binding (CaLB domain) family protein [Rhynchospora pubera]|uniref:Calcium-dependent lipid-binding (CaLB domain) family protein n=1 Tax=Rhynchospora pubera TaxID=906938 RepID=A0AAV8FK95_9POAL|nr:Calcium-dependent lipid-binding (CaLB domain) family protein [Rhynchospora pubera]